MSKSKKVVVYLPRCNNYSLVPDNSSVIQSAKVIADNPVSYANIYLQWYIKPASITPSETDKVTLCPVRNPRLFLSYNRTNATVELSRTKYLWHFSTVDEEDSIYNISPYFPPPDGFLTKGPGNATNVYLTGKGEPYLVPRQEWALGDAGDFDEASQKLIKEQPLEDEPEETAEDSAE